MYIQGHRNTWDVELTLWYWWWQVLIGKWQCDMIWVISRKKGSKPTKKIFKMQVLETYIVPQWHNCVNRIHIFIELNTLRPRQNGRHFTHDIFKCIFFNENVKNVITFSLRFVPNGPNNNISALIQIMAWRRPGVKPIPEPMMVRLPTHMSLGHSERYRE